MPTSSLPKEIAVSGVGDPLAKSTWSGTPYGICSALASIDRLGEAYDTENYAPRTIARAARIMARLYYANSLESSRGRITRSLRAHGLGRFLERHCPRDILHFGSLGLPLLQTGGMTRHHLFCDSTWHLWSRFSTASDRCKPRLLSDNDKLERKTYGQMTLIFSVSDYVKQDLIQHYDVSPAKIIVVGTGRGSISPYHGEKDYSQGRILFVAKERFVDKGGEILVDGFKQAVAANPSLHLTLVGDEKYHEFARQSQNITAHGFVSAEHLQQLFNEASLFAMPGYNEPWGLVYLEALSCRTPVLGLDRNAMREITRNGAYGFALKSATPKTIAETILEAFADPKRLERMGREGQKYCLREFTWGKTVDRIVTAIDALEGA